MTMIIDGKKLVADILIRLATQPMPRRFLAAVVVGNDPARESFVRQKMELAQRVCVDFRPVPLPPDAPQVDILALLEKFAKDGSCGGIIVQLPLPEHVNRDTVIAAIPREKDVDNLRGDAAVLAPAAGVVSEILLSTHYSLPTTKVAVLGAKGLLVGRPVTAWLRSQGASVAGLDIGDDLSLLKDADVVVLGTGQPGIVTPGMVEEEALVIDFGYGMNNGKVCGDFDSSTLNPIPSTLSYTPTPGGTGPILVAKLFENFYALNSER